MLSACNSEDSVNENRLFVCRRSDESISAYNDQENPAGGRNENLLENLDQNCQ